ncbi:MAG: nucleoid-associated protein [Gammaproteobacteria bacterium]|nr:nucleoid-associated protein [Gammaproteobacteria bacterium]
MPLKHAIAHRIKSNTDGKVELTLREQELPLEGASETLLNKLKSSFLARISREHGSFNPEGAISPLQQGLEAFLGDKQDFAAMSAGLLQWFKQQLGENKVALDAHLLLFVEHSFDHHLFHLFVAGRSESLSLNEELAIIPSFGIDTGPSLFAIKVDLAEWRERKDYAYLSLLPPRGNQPLGELFTQLTGFSNGLNKQEATLAFLEGVESYARQLPEERVDDYRNRVVEYCMEREQQDAPVQLRSLAESMEEIDVDSFVRAVAGDDSGDAPEIRLDRRSLRRYVKFTGREKDLAISFNSYQLNKRVHYDAKSDTLSINGLPSALRKQLQGYMEGEKP